MHAHDCNYCLISLFPAYMEKYWIWSSWNAEAYPTSKRRGKQVYIMQDVDLNSN